MICRIWSSAAATLRQRRRWGKAQEKRRRDSSRRGTGTRKKSRSKDRPLRNLKPAPETKGAAPVRESLLDRGAGELGGVVGVAAPFVFAALGLRPKTP